MKNNDNDKSLMISLWKERLTGTSVYLTERCREFHDGTIKEGISFNWNEIKVNTESQLLGYIMRNVSLKNITLTGHIERMRAKGYHLTRYMTSLWECLKELKTGRSSNWETLLRLNNYDVFETLTAHVLNSQGA